MLDFLYIAVSWVLLRWHDLFTAIGFSQTERFRLGAVDRLPRHHRPVLLFRLFIKQVHYQRNMQRMQPKIQKLREKYKNDRAELNRQMMKLQQEEGFNPLVRLPADAAADPGVHRALPRAAAPVERRTRSAAGRPQPPADALHVQPAARPATPRSAKIFDAPLAASFHDPAR